MLTTPPSWILNDSQNNVLWSNNLEWTEVSFFYIFFSQKLSMKQSFQYEILYLWKSILASWILNDSQNNTLSSISREWT